MVVQVVAGHEEEFALQQEAARVAREELRYGTSTPTATTTTAPPIARPSALSPEVSEKLMSGEAATVTEAQTQIVEEAQGYATPAEAKTLGVSRVRAGEEYIEVMAKSGKILKVPKRDWTPQMKAQYKETGTVYGTRFLKQAPPRASGQWVVVKDPREASRVASLFLEEGVEIPYAVGRIERRRVKEGFQYKIISKEDVETQKIKVKAEQLWEKATMEEKSRWRMSTIFSKRLPALIGSTLPIKPYRKPEDIYKEHYVAAAIAGKKGKRAEFIVSHALLNPIVGAEVIYLGGMALRAATVAGTTTKIISKTGVSTELIRWLGAGASVVGTASEVAVVREDIVAGDYQAAATRVLMDVAAVGIFAAGWKAGEPKPVYKVKQPVGFEERTEAIRTKSGAELEKMTDIKYIEYETTKRPKIVVPERVAYEAGEMERAIAGGREVRTVKRGTRIFDVVEGKGRWADDTLKSIMTAFESDVPAGDLLREKRVWAIFKDQTIPKGAKIIKTDAYKMLESIDDIVGATGMGSSFKYSVSRAAGTKLITIPGLAHAQVEKIVYVKKIPFLPLVKTTTFRKAGRDQARVTMKIYPTIKLPDIAKVKQREAPETILARIIKPPKEAVFSRVGKLKPPFKPVKPKPPKPDIPILEPPKRKRVLRLEEWERQKYGKVSKKAMKTLMKKKYLFEEATGLKLKKKVRQEEELDSYRLIGLQAPGRVDQRMDQFLEQQMGMAVIYGFRLPSKQRVTPLSPSMAEIVIPETFTPGGPRFPKYRKEPREPRARKGKPRRKGYEEKFHPGDIMRLIGARPSKKTKRGKKKSELEDWGVI